ncbi:hypothetical protein SSP35_28_00030 [Streptomyces sp. NBRC 110611]|uniref:LuxR C-terminal-related transcriptional regulator n=1 Tax=Streptomyces sp. NBRC 110611 TaxID=1621259 RepID=UPI000834E61C|nr:LuxR C-terminal-related transcriptional regulator [Streptomyces sp. NBRC 110611]GAU71128.1 hypothetical protein SSP35_28_00030 [Streptomyces sp. NBRC 110611]
MTTSVEKVILAPRERQVIKGLANGSTLAAVALNLKITKNTAASYLKNAKYKLRGVTENSAALAVAYATEAIDRPDLLAHEGLLLPCEQRELVPLIARGMRATQMAIKLKRSVDLTRRDARQLMANLQARNPAHLVTRSWQYQIITAEQVLAWLP